MAKEDDLDLDLDDGDQPAKKSKAKLFIIIGVVVLLLGVSATATLMMTGMLSGDDEELAAEQSDTGGKADKNKKGKNKKGKKEGIDCLRNIFYLRNIKKNLNRD